MSMKITPSVVALVAVVVAAVTILLALGKDPGLLIGFVNSVGVVLLYGEAQTIKQQTNGTTHRLMNIVEAQTPAGGTSSATPSTTAVSAPPGSTPDKSSPTP